jgi:hypothetical protein
VPTVFQVIGVAAAGFLLVNAVTNPHRGWIRLWVQHRRQPEVTDIPMLGIILYLLIGTLPELFGASDRVVRVVDIIAIVLFTICMLGGLAFWLWTRRTARSRPVTPSSPSPATSEEPDSAGSA